MTQHDPSKRRFILAATYVAPAILTLKVAPTFASVGSGRGNGNPGGSGEEPGYGGSQNPGGGDSGGSGGEYSGGGDSGGGSQGGGSSSSASYHKKKKRNWYWPFT